MLQDDIALCSGLRAYLETHLWLSERPGIVSLHTPSHLASSSGTGFYQADLGWHTWGAQALVMANASVRALLADPAVIEHRLKGMLGGLKNVDSVLGDWCRRSARPFWLHAPSLVEHTGEASTLWPEAKLAGRRLSADFPGEDSPLAELLEHHRQTHGVAAPPSLRMLADGTLEQDGVSLTAPHLQQVTASALAGLNLSAPEPGIAIIVSAHTPYLGYLPECLAAWDAQQPRRKILALDGCDYAAPEGWEVIRGAWRHPGPARNAGLALCEDCSWVIHWDADNVPALGFLATARQRAREASEMVGVFHSEIIAESHSLGPARRVTDDTGGDPREAYFVDTASLWRRDALLHIGGWPEHSPKLDDWDVSCRLRLHGWQFAPLGASITLREHEARRTHAASTAEAVWQLRPLGIITLMAGREDLLPRWVETLSRLELPPQCGLTVVDSSDSATFRAALDAALASVASRFQRLTVLTAPARQASLASGYAATHHRVGRLYGLAVNASPEAALLTWEDDVFPHEPNALRQLAQHLLPRQGVAAVAAVYASRAHPAHAVASSQRDYWRAMPLLESLGSEVRSIGMVGGGFTLWSRAALEQQPILGSYALDERHRLGWDGFVCRRLNAARWRLLLHGGVRCDHCCQR